MGDFELGQKGMTQVAILNGLYAFWKNIEASLVLWEITHCLLEILHILYPHKKNTAYASGVSPTLEVLAST